MKWLSLKQKYAAGLVIVVAVSIFNVIAVRHLSKAQVVVSLERQYFAEAMEIRRSLEAVAYRTPLPMAVSRAGLLAHVGRAEQTAEAATEELFWIERKLFEMIGFGEVISLPAKAIQDLRRMRNSIERDQGQDITPELVAKLEVDFEEVLSNGKAFGPVVDQVTSFLKTVYWTVAISGACLLVGVFLILRDGTLPPLRLALSIAREIAKGDLTGRIEIKTFDEMGALLGALSDMRENLRGNVERMRSASAEVSSAVGRLSGAFGQVTAGSLRQSDGAAATASAVEEITVSIVSVAQSAEGVLAVSASSLVQSRQGTASLAELSAGLDGLRSAMSEITETVQIFVASAHSISGLTRDVREIADQTNLLALNAAIEAARAGEHGAGFAVVADEVRKLAEKSAGSASKIDAVTNVLELQSEQVGQAIRGGLGALESALDNVKEVGGVLVQAQEFAARTRSGLDSITAAVKEQSVAGNDITKNVEQIARMAEEVHEAIKGTSETVKVLEMLSSELKVSSDRFNV